MFKIQAYLNTHHNPEWVTLIETRQVVAPKAATMKLLAEKSMCGASIRTVDYLNRLISVGMGDDGSLVPALETKRDALEELSDAYKKAEAADEWDNAWVISESYDILDNLE